MQLNTKARHEMEQLLLRQPCARMRWAWLTGRTIPSSVSGAHAEAGAPGVHTKNTRMHLGAGEGESHTRRSRRSAVGSTAAAKLPPPEASSMNGAAAAAADVAIRGREPRSRLYAQTL